MKFLGKFRRLTGPDGSKKITRSALECEVTQKLRERGAAGDFSPVRWGLHYTGTVQGVAKHRARAPPHRLGDQP